MLHSTNRKLALSGWLHEYSPDAYRNSLRLQKFLFLYEALCKAKGREYDFSHLKGYVRGPVFGVIIQKSRKHLQMSQGGSLKSLETK